VHAFQTPALQGVYPSRRLVRLAIQPGSSYRWSDALVCRKEERCLAQMWATALDILSAGQDVVLELGLVEVASRNRFYSLVESAGYELSIYLLDTPCDVRQ